MDETLNAQIKANQEKLELLKAEERTLSKKKNEIDRFNTDARYQRIQDSKRDLEEMKKVNVSLKNTKNIEKAIVLGREYMDSAAHCMTFINEDFNGVVPFFAKNLILMGAYSGEGKSTTTANIAYPLLQQGKKVLVISNEEMVADVYNRVTCLFRGLIYSNHEKFTKEQKDMFDESAKILSQRMYVIDNNSEVSGITTSYEGITGILNKLIEENERYDVIIIDYYQNVTDMKSDPSMESFKVQDKLAVFLDDFKNRYSAPIVVMAQMKPRDKENTQPFKERIEGRKSIYNKCTFAIEARADKQKMCTEWTVQKTRFNNCHGKVVLTGWEMGKYIKYTDEFKFKVFEMNEKRQLAQYQKKELEKYGQTGTKTP